MQLWAAGWVRQYDCMQWVWRMVPSGVCWGEWVLSAWFMGVLGMCTERWWCDRAIAKGYITYSEVYPHALFSSLCVCVRFCESCLSEDLNTVECFIILLTHSDRVTHIYTSINYPVTWLSIISSDNGLSLDWRLVILWTNAEYCHFESYQTNLSEILNEIDTVLIKEMYLKTLRYFKILCPYFITLYYLESSFVPSAWDTEI